MRLGFHSWQLGLRGTEVALFDYASGARKQLGHEPVVYSPRRGQHHPDALRHFEQHFEVVLYTHPREVRCDALYAIKRGLPDRLSCRAPQLVHAVFDVTRPHGHRFAAVSEWLAEQKTAPTPALRLLGQQLTARLERRTPPKALWPVPWVPHIVEIAQHEDDLRAELGIPADAVVFGRSGGEQTFDLPFVKQAVIDALARRDDAWFVFLLTPRFVDHPRVVHLEGSSDPVFKRAFVNTADYMLHAREVGETFGLSVAEFSAAGRPVLTWSKSVERAHLRHLEGLEHHRYDDHAQVLELLLRLPRRAPDPAAVEAWKRFSPEAVMPRFARVFLDA
ncbi:MAG: hypothetical protein HZA61_13410 [Candidatus Eisenbacteria bacterium]|uniref:Uncharacterized protein n=1 Tax=Eiseniibacteriota bacterium TaxID=2212470 RepID=A0A933SDN5_UNCEI|nr:hypothetical protein [Candidatus Eisenbacteria bacterium]